MSRGRQWELEWERGEKEGWQWQSKHIGGPLSTCVCVYVSVTCNLYLVSCGYIYHVSRVMLIMNATFTWANASRNCNRTANCICICICICNHIHICICFVYLTDMHFMLITCHRNVSFVIILTANFLLFQFS